MASCYDDIRHIVHIISGEDVACEHCDVWPVRSPFAATVNHYIAVHGYRLLHVGSESGAAASDVGTFTVAVVGK